MGIDCHSDTVGEAVYRKNHPENNAPVYVGPHGHHLSGKPIPVYYGNNTIRCNMPTGVPETTKRSRVIAFKRNGCQCFMVEVVDTPAYGMSGRDICDCIGRPWGSGGLGGGKGGGSYDFVMMDGGSTTTLYSQSVKFRYHVIGTSPTFFIICGRRGQGRP